MKINKALIYKTINYFGYLLPENEKVNNYIFAKLINEHISLNNPLSKQMYSEVSKAIDLRFKRLKTGVKVYLLK